MRKQLLGLLVPLLTFVVTTSAVAADMTGKGVAASAALQKLEVADSQDGLRVEFRAKGTLAPKSRRSILRHASSSTFPTP